MDTRLLKMFCAVADSSSLVKAASKLHLTPSAISHGIKALEVELGCRLFDRAGKKMVLTNTGEQLLVQIRPPLAAIDAAATSIQQLAKSGKARLRIGAAATACGYILPSVIRELRKAHPNIELQVESGTSAEMMELVRANRVDLALGVAPEKHLGLDVRPVFRDELLFVLAPSHPWATRAFTRDELRQQPVILMQRASLTTQLVHRFFHTLNLVPTTVMEIASVQAIKELVRLNLGVSILAPWTVEKELLRGTLVMRPLAGKPVMRNWVVISLAGRRFTQEQETFCRLCRNYATGMRLDRRDIPVYAK